MAGLYCGARCRSARSCLRPSTKPCPVAHRNRAGAGLTMPGPLQYYCRHDKLSAELRSAFWMELFFPLPRCATAPTRQFFFQPSRGEPPLIPRRHFSYFGTDSPQRRLRQHASNMRWGRSAFEVLRNESPPPAEEMAWPGTEKTFAARPNLAVEARRLVVDARRRRDLPRPKSI